MSDMTSTRPYVIAKRAVWEAYQQVKGNRGAAGIDDETIVMFEQNLSRNLYKLWNRMSSGSYFPPPAARRSSLTDLDEPVHALCVRYLDEAKQSAMSVCPLCR